MFIRKIFSYLVPQTNSLFLGCFVHIVEATGLIIRALSLGLRLTCNVLCVQFHIPVIIICILLLESLIMIIQAFIITKLCAMYTEEA